MTAIVLDPLERVGLKLTEVDKYSPEMQNPEITEPAGAGDVPKANFKMIAALAVKRGEIARTDIDSFVAAHGLPGFAPTQGHVPSGVPSIGYFRDEIMAGRMRRAQIIGKGSLFLGRMTNLFDGVSFLFEKNKGMTEEKAQAQAQTQQGGAVATESRDELRKIMAEALRELAQSLVKE
jgi:betaine reductase